MTIIGLLDHPYAHCVGWALLHSLWEGALIALVFAFLRLGLRRRSANARYLAACIMLAMVIAVPIATLFYLSKPPPPAFSPAVPALQPLYYQVNAVAAMLDSSGPGTATPQYIRHGAKLLDRCLPWMVLLWCVGVMGLSGRWVHGSRWIRHIKTFELEPLGPEWLGPLQSLCRKLDVSQSVRLFKSALVEVPLVVGWLRPVILLPASALSGLTPEQLEAILAHELAHVRRCDYLVNVFQNMVETLMFYHPAVWWISRCIREEREHCCDDLVVRVCGDRTAYVRALVTLEEARGYPRLAFAASGGSLVYRVRRLLGVANEGCPPSPAELSGLALVAIGCVLVVAGIWLLNCPPTYQSSALIKVNPLVLPVQTTAPDAPNSAGNYYPYYLQTECLVIRSPAVLQLAIKSLGPKENANPIGPHEKTIATKELSELKERLNLRPIPSTSVIEIQATDLQPAEAACIANAVANAYKEHRLEQRRRSFSSSLDTLEARFVDQTEKIREVQQKVDILRAELRVPEAVLSENMPTVTSENVRAALMSAETLRHIESLRIESQAEYVKQKALLDRLTKLDPNDLPATIPAIGVQDNQLAAFSESLALVDQRLVSLQKELGPEHIECQKTSAQQDDLRRKIRARTDGILMGLQAKCTSTAEGLLALSNAVLNAQNSDRETAALFRPYFDARRELEELIRFRQILNTKIAMERTDLQLPQDCVEIIEEALAPAQAIAPNRPRAVALLAIGAALGLVGWLIAKTAPRMAAKKA